ncbi:uncharacterized protein CLAFUR5_12170 [Fulvia fulva]|uniref:Uncharacterized protein n=1 Tax=Passalora fulva TaxID=5499 RepID=A0A9Q8PI09_PASFU|nr:uncharacterized protein CLAFUR5_12170 [Fulvia fulva]UJO22843.1 hypothetical protein CLAFUR5_12170 [Fulvia fulva]
MHFLTQISTLALSAATYTAALPIPVHDQSFVVTSKAATTNSTNLAKRDASICYVCGHGFDDFTVSHFISKFCVEGLQGFPSAQQVYPDLFYTSQEMGQLSLALRASPDPSCPKVTYMTVDECKANFAKIGESCNVGEETKQGGAWRTACLDFEINPNLKGSTESSCGADTIWSRGA